MHTLKTNRLILIAGLLGALGCTLAGARRGADGSSATRTPLPEIAPGDTAAPTVAAEPTITSAWVSLGSGIEYMVAQIPVEGVSQPADVQLIRVDPKAAQIKPFYAPDSPTSIQDWQARTGAPIVLNGGFFQRNNQTMGLMYIDGQRYGESFDRHGGMFSINGDSIEVRSLAQFPYHEDEVFEQAFQGRPMILYPGGFPVQFDDVAADLSRRTAIGQDRSGRIVFMVNDYGIVSLYRLRDWLANERPDLDMNVAFNLDGGQSTGLAINAGGNSLVIESRTALPIVIAIFPKQ
jgi:uncharacterized protein YigE (DUF2233 family)